MATEKAQARKPVTKKKVAAKVPATIPTLTKRDWLAQSPPDNYIRNSPDNGRDYIPIGFVEVMLDELCEDSQPWTTENFHFEISKLNNLFIANARVELVVHYDGMTRRLTGAKSFRVNNGEDENQDYAGAALSHCLISAAGKLGNRFGRALNGRLDDTPPEVQVKKEKGKKTPVKTEEQFTAPVSNGKKRPDIIALKRYENALKEKNEEEIKELEDTFNFNAQTADIITNEY